MPLLTRSLRTSRTGEGGSDDDVDAFRDGCGDQPRRLPPNTGDGEGIPGIVDGAKGEREGVLGTGMEAWEGVKLAGENRR